MGDDVLNHPDVLAVIRAILVRMGVARQDLEDAINDVRVAAWKTLRNEPETNVDRCIAVVRPIAERDGIDRLRLKYSRGPHDKGPSGDADEHAHPATTNPTAIDPVDRARALEAVARQVEAGNLPPYTLEILEAQAASVPDRQAAAELGVEYARYRNEKRQTLRLSRAAIVASGLTGLFAVAAFVLGLRQSRAIDDLARHLPAPVVPSAAPSQAPAPTPRGPNDLTPEEVATKLRFEAHGAFARGDWYTCIEKYRMAYSLDKQWDDQTMSEGRRCAELNAARPQDDGPQNYEAKPGRR